MATYKKYYPVYKGMVRTTINRSSDAKPIKDAQKKLMTVTTGAHLIKPANLQYYDFHQEQYNTPTENPLGRGYSDPYEINSIADTILGTFDPNMKRLGGDAWFNKVPILNIIPSYATELYNNFVRPFTKNGGGAGMIVSNIFNDLSETTDLLLNPIRGLTSEGIQSLKDSILATGSGRKSYRFNIDNAILEMGAEMLLDPVNWITFGAGTIAKSGLANASKSILKAALKESGKEITEESIKQFGKVFAKNAIKQFAEGNTVGAADEFAKLFKVTMNKFIKSDLDNVTLDVLKNTDLNKFFTSIVDSAMYGDSIKKVASIEKLYNGSRKFDEVLLKSVLHSNPIAYGGGKVIKFTGQALVQNVVVPIAQARKTQALRKVLQNADLPDSIKVEEIIKGFENDDIALLAALETANTPYIPKDVAQDVLDVGVRTNTKQVINTVLNYTQQDYIKYARGDADALSLIDTVNAQIKMAAGINNTELKTLDDLIDYVKKLNTGELGEGALINQLHDVVANLEDVKTLIKNREAHYATEFEKNIVKKATSDLKDITDDIKGKTINPEQSVTKAIPREQVEQRLEHTSIVSERTGIHDMPVRTAKEADVSELDLSKISKDNFNSVKNKTKYKQTLNKHIDDMMFNTKGSEVSSKLFLDLAEADDPIEFLINLTTKENAKKYFTKHTVHYANILSDALDNAKSLPEVLMHLMTDAKVGSNQLLGAVTGYCNLISARAQFKTNVIPLAKKVAQLIEIAPNLCISDLRRLSKQYISLLKSKKFIATYVNKYADLKKLMAYNTIAKRIEEQAYNGADLFSVGLKEFIADSDLNDAFKIIDGYAKTDDLSKAAIQDWYRARINKVDNTIANIQSIDKLANKEKLLSTLQHYRTFLKESEFATQHVRKYPTAKLESVLKSLNDRLNRIDDIQKNIIGDFKDDSFSKFERLINTNNLEGMSKLIYNECKVGSEQIFKVNAKDIAIARTEVFNVFKNIKQLNRHTLRKLKVAVHDIDNHLIKELETKALTGRSHFKRLPNIDSLENSLNALIMLQREGKSGGISQLLYAISCAIQNGGKIDIASLGSDLEETLKIKKVISDYTYHLKNIKEQLDRIAFFSDMNYAPLQVFTEGKKLYTPNSDLFKLEKGRIKTKAQELAKQELIDRGLLTEGAEHIHKLPVGDVDGKTSILDLIKHPENKRVITKRMGSAFKDTIASSTSGIFSTIKSFDDVTLKAFQSMQDGNAVVDYFTDTLSRLYHKGAEYPFEVKKTLKKAYTDVNKLTKADVKLIKQYVPEASDLILSGLKENKDELFLRLRQQVYDKIETDIIKKLALDVNTGISKRLDSFIKQSDGAIALNGDRIWEAFNDIRVGITDELSRIIPYAADVGLTNYNIKQIADETIFKMRTAMRITETTETHVTPLMKLKVATDNCCLSLYEQYPTTILTGDSVLYSLKVENTYRLFANFANQDYNELIADIASKGAHSLNDDTISLGTVLNNLVNQMPETDTEFEAWAQRISEDLNLQVTKNYSFNELKSELQALRSDIIALQQYAYKFQVTKDTFQKLINIKAPNAKAEDIKAIISVINNLKGKSIDYVSRHSDEVFEDLFNRAESYLYNTVYYKDAYNIEAIIERRGYGWGGEQHIASADILQDMAIFDDDAILSDGTKWSIREEMVKALKAQGIEEPDPNQFLFFDIETTGTGEHSSILELGIVRKGSVQAEENASTVAQQYAKATDAFEARVGLDANEARVFMPQRDYLIKTHTTPAEYAAKYGAGNSFVAVDGKTAIPNTAPKIVNVNGTDFKLSATDAIVYDLYKYMETLPEKTVFVGHNSNTFDLNVIKNSFQQLASKLPAGTIDSEIYAKFIWMDTLQTLQVKNGFMGINGAFRAQTEAMLRQYLDQFTAYDELAHTGWFDPERGAIYNKLKRIREHINNCFGEGGDVIKANVDSVYKNEAKHIGTVLATNGSWKDIDNCLSDAIQVYKHLNDEMVNLNSELDNLVITNHEVKNIFNDDDFLLNAAIALGIEDVDDVIRLFGNTPNLTSLMYRADLLKDVDPKLVNILGYKIKSSDSLLLKYTKFNKYASIEDGVPIKLHTSLSKINAYYNNIKNLSNLTEYADDIAKAMEFLNKVPADLCIKTDLNKATTLNLLLKNLNYNIEDTASQLAILAYLKRHLSDAFMENIPESVRKLLSDNSMYYRIVNPEYIYKTDAGYLPYTKRATKFDNIRTVEVADELESAQMRLENSTKDPLDLYSTGLETNKVVSSRAQILGNMLQPINKCLKYFKTRLRTYSAKEADVYVKQVYKATDNLSKQITLNNLTMELDDLVEHLATNSRFITMGANDVPPGLIKEFEERLASAPPESAASHIHLIKNTKNNVDQIILVLDKDLDVTEVWNAGARRREVRINGQLLSGAPVKKSFDFDYAFKGHIDPEAVKHIKDGYASLNHITNNRCLGTLGDRITKQQMSDYYDLLPDAAKALLPDKDSFIQDDFFIGHRFNHTNVGSREARLLSENIPITDMFNNMSNTASYFANIKITETGYLDIFYNKYMSMNAGSLAKLSDEELFQLCKKHPEYVVTYLTDSPKYGATVVQYKIRSVKDIALARSLDASILPYQTFAEVFTNVNKNIFEGNPGNKFLEFWRKYIYTQKVGYLIYPETFLKNFGDSLIKNMIETEAPLEILKNYKEAAKLSKEYSDAVKTLQDLLGIDFKQLDEFFTTNKILVNGEVMDTPKFIQHYLNNKAGAIKLAEQYDTAVAEMLKLDRNGRLSDELIDFYFKNMNPSLDYETFRALHEFFTNAPSVGRLDVWDKYYTKIFNNSDMDPSLWSSFIQYSRKFMKPNEYIEQIARLGEYLTMQELGLNVTESYYKIAKTHFNYDLKSRGEQWAELLLPFYSYNVRNLEFFANAIERHPWVGRAFSRFLTLQEFDETDYEELKWNRSLQYAMTSGAIPIGDNNATLKLSPSFVSALSLATTPVNSTLNLLTPAAKMLINSGLSALPEGSSKYSRFGIGVEKENELLDLVPFIGAIKQKYLESGPRTAARTGNGLAYLFPSLFGSIKRYPEKEYFKRSKTAAPAKKSYKKYRKYFRKYNTYNRYYKRYYKHYYDNMFKINRHYYKRHYYYVQKSYYNRRNFYENLYKRLYTKAGKSRIASKINANLNARMKQTFRDQITTMRYGPRAYRY